MNDNTKHTPRKWKVEIYDLDTKEIIKTVPCSGGYRQAGRVETGIWINLNYGLCTRIVDESGNLPGPISEMNAEEY